MMSEKSIYEMTLSLNLLQHLGVGLYSNTPAVLSEAVANAWDADATLVDINVDQDEQKITIEDNGIGMNIDDVNKKYLCVGYDRRDAKEGITLQGRSVMGRKGIGKLSLFSIADTVTVHSKKNGEQHGFRMNIKDIKKILKKSNIYKPTPVKSDHTLEKGTRIVLTDLKKERPRIGSIKKKLARRFTIMDKKKFQVNINGDPISATDRGYQKKLQYVWVFGKLGKTAMKNVTNVKIENIPSCVSDDDPTLCIDGWIGTIKEQKGFGEDDENLNKIVIMIRGKMAQENILDELKERGIYSNYIVGEIHADFLDYDDQPDITTTSRQKINEEDERYKKLRLKIEASLKIIQSKWTKFRNDEGAEKALLDPIIKEWYSKLETRDKKAAERLFGKINQLKLGDGQLSKNHLFISGILTFESLKLRGMLEKLDTINPENLSGLNEIFLQLEDLEASAYYQTTKRRLGIIDKLQSFVEKGVKEKIIQKHIFKNLWLLDPSWEAATRTEQMEIKVKNAFKKIDAKLSDEELNSRLDIQYCTTGDRHVIIELKKPDKAINGFKLQEQVTRYREAVIKILQGMDKPNAPVEIVCIVGKPLVGWNTNTDREETTRNMLKTISVRIIMYDVLIENAQKAYQDYTNSKKKVSRIYDLITKISNDDHNQLNSTIHENK